MKMKFTILVDALYASKYVNMFNISTEYQREENYIFLKKNDAFSSNYFKYMVFNNSFYKYKQGSCKNLSHNITNISNIMEIPCENLMEKKTL